MGKKEPSTRALAQAERDRAMDEKLRKDYYDPEARKRRRKNVRVGFCVTLAIMLICSVVNWGVVSGWGNVQIERINLSGNDGAKFSGLVYRPANATDSTPAPAIIMLHGNSGNARNQESWAVEFSRRGFVVVVPDLYGAGDSLGYFNGGPGQRADTGARSVRGITEESNLFFDYMTSLSYVDAGNVLVSGHSMGGGAALIIGAQNDVKGILSASGSPRKLVIDAHPELWDLVVNYKGNVAFVYGTNDMGNTPETVPEKEGVLEVFQAHTGNSDMAEIETGKVYGSFADGDGIVLIYDQRIHEGAFVDQGCIEHLVEYGQDMIGDAVPNYIDPADQVWMVKDYTGLAGIFAFAAFLMATALLLIEEVPVFAKVRRPIARNVGFRGTGLVIATLIGILAPYLVIKTDAFGIVGGNNYENLWSLGFDMGYSNMGFGVIIGLTIVCIIGSAVYVLTERKKKGLAPVDFGVTPEGYDSTAPAGAKAKAIAGMVLRTLGVAAITIAIGWSYLQLQTVVLGTDFYSFFFGVKDMPIEKIPYFLNYLAVFIICFLILSIDMNVIRRLPSTGNETKDLIIAIIVNVVVAATMVIIIVAVKWHLQTISSPADTNLIWAMGLDTQRIWGMPVGMTVAAAGSTFIYKKTGNLWLCALLVGTVACLMGVLYGGARFHYLGYTYPL